MAHNRKPPHPGLPGGGGKDQHPNYAAMAETLESLARELAQRAAAEGDNILAVQSDRLLQLAAAIRSDLAKSG